MKEERKNRKKLIISHVADVDGISALILAQLHFKDIDYGLVEFSELEQFLKNIIEDGSYKQYEEIFITDVSFSPAALELVDSNEELKSKIKHFDHHVSEASKMDRYSFVNEVNEKDGKKACGTTLFYDYIKDGFKYKSEFLDKYLEAVRAYDTGGPFCGNEFGVDLTTLFAIIGIERFIKKMSSGIKAGENPLTEDDMQAIQSEYQRKAEYVELCDKTLLRLVLNGHKIGVSVSESYRSDVGNVLSRKYKDELDYILILNYVRRQFSFRTVRDDINVAEIAKSITPFGGGHPKAAGMPVNKDTLFILDLIRQAMQKEEEMKLERKQPQ